MSEISPKLSVVAPCHNESANLREFVERIGQALEPLGIDFEVVLADDASNDDSWEVLGQLAREYPWVRALRLERNGGQSAALWAGLEAARGRYLATLDSDLQNDPAELPRFLEAIETRETDFVNGNRVEARSKGDSWVKVAGSRFANWFRNRVIGSTVSDSGCSYRIMRRECLDGIWFFRGAHRFLPTLVKMEGARISELPISHAPRREGKSHYGIFDRLRVTVVDLFAVGWMQSRRIDSRVSERIGNGEIPAAGSEAGSDASADALEPD